MIFQNYVVQVKSVCQTTQLNAPSWNEIETKLNSNLKFPSQYFTQNNLLVNLDKTNCLVFQTKNFKKTPGPVLCTGEFKISRVSEINFLGLTVDTNLN